MVTKTVVHFEIPAKDVEALSKFYSDVFGWKFEKTPMGGGMDYWMISTGPQNKSVWGGMYKKQMDAELPRNYIAVPDMDIAISTFISAGGKEMMGKQEVPETGWTYIGIDPEGNPIGMYQAMPKRQARRATRPARKSARSKKSKN
jgi:predicted enzyme related to lactoylglutathione lyase